VGSLAGGLVADWADDRWPRYGRIVVSQVSILAALPAIWYLLTSAYEVMAIILSAVVAAFFLDWTRRGVKQPLVQAVVRPELRSTAMALTEFFQGAVASVIIILFGGFADQFGLTQTLLVLACGFWVVALFVTIPYYFVYPSEAQRLRDAMKERREIIEGGTA
jgi:MFS family permease